MQRHLDRLLQLARITLLFGQVRRVTRHPDGEPESDTTHTVMLCLVACELAPALGCDPGLLVQLALVHDLPETYALDTDASRTLTPAQVRDKHAREAAALVRLQGQLAGSPVLTLLAEYEAQQSKEARIVRYLDKVLPKLTHVINGGLAWQALGLNVAAIEQSHTEQRERLRVEYPDLAPTLEPLLLAAMDVAQRVALARPTPAKAEGT